MSELDAVRKAQRPASVSSLERDLMALGVSPHHPLLVHSSLSALGWVCGGAVAVLEALTRALGPEGTLVLPAFSADVSDPAYWVKPPVPEAWWEPIRKTMPAFDPAATPTRWIGRIPECFRRLPGVVRGPHPYASFAARGPLAERIVAPHPLPYSLGDASPLARLYELDARILLLGVDHNRNSSLHLAENRARFAGRRTITQGAPVLRRGRRTWATFAELDMRVEDFRELGAAFGAPVGRVACAEARLFPMRVLVDFGVAWMEEHRTT